MFNFSFKQQVLTGFSISLIFVLISAISSYLSLKSLSEDANWQNHTHEVINLVQRIETQLVNAETGVRGFVISQDNKFLEPYTTNISKINPDIRELKRKVADNEQQSAKVDVIQQFANQKLADMKHVLEENEVHGREAAVTAILTGRGQDLKNKMFAASEDLKEHEFILLNKRKENTKRSADQTTLIVIVSSIVIFGLILFLFSYIKTTFDHQKLTEAKIRDSNTQLEKISAENEQKNWLLSGASAINEVMRGEQGTEQLSANIVTQLCNYLQAPVGTLYVLSNSNKSFAFAAGYAYQRQKSTTSRYLPGEGLIGQAALEKTVKLIEHVPKDYLKVNSALGETDVTSILVLPVVFQNETVAVVELGLREHPDQASMLFLQNVAESIGVAINSAIARAKLKALFEQTQQQAEELQTQQEELRTTNEELIYKSEQLQASEEELRVQQEELRQTNAELEEKAQQLEERNIIVNQAREAMSLKAEELEISSKYKSEFLANMSHELRTPLNSILILARILKENRPENLTEDQIKYAGVIHTAGSDLLTLINDILDLSKIESGKIDLTIESVHLAAVQEDMVALFGELAKSKKIQFQTNIQAGLEEKILSDQARLEQIIKNLLSNAFKFTPEHGQIVLNIAQASAEQQYHNRELKNRPEKVIAISVKDSGIGIPEDKQKLIFEAFQQADGSTSRKYGGTGLGLSISKELAHLLGGEIHVESEPNAGSMFTLFIPAGNGTGSVTAEIVSSKEQLKDVIPNPLPLNITKTSDPGRKQTLLIVEDDLVFADVLDDYAREKGFETILAHSGDTALDLAINRLPDAIVLDVMLPVMDGWTILKKLKANPNTRHIPIHMMSAGSEKESTAKQEGAIGFLKKPVEKEQLDLVFNLLSRPSSKDNLNHVLVIEDQELQSKILTQQLSERGVEVRQAFTGKEALDFLAIHRFDCIILDLKLPDVSGFELLDKIKMLPGHLHTPVIINTAMELDDAKMAHIMKHSEAMVLKSNKSNDRLIDEVSLFMNKLRQVNPEPGPTINKSRNTTTIEKTLEGKTILIADDDMRNIFALSSALQVYAIQILIATNGKEAIQKLEESDHTDLVLMDIMMPEMDGYEAMRTIRQNKRFAKLPMIALTAKAMKNDREKCIEAGANDYISKPVDMDKLLSMLRVWLS